MKKRLGLAAMFAAAAVSLGAIHGVSPASATIDVSGPGARGSEQTCIGPLCPNTAHINVPTLPPGTTVNPCVIHPGWCQPI